MFANSNNFSLLLRRTLRTSEANSACDEESILVVKLISRVRLRKQLHGPGIGSWIYPEVGRVAVLPKIVISAPCLCPHWFLIPLPSEEGGKEGVGGFVRLELPQELSRVHHTFHVSNLKKCYADEPLVMPLEGIHVDDKLQFVEEPVEIMEREIKRLKRSRIPLVKVRWNSRRGPEFTWEREDSFKQKYPQLFTNRASSSTTRCEASFTDWATEALATLKIVGYIHFVYTELRARPRALFGVPTMRNYRERHPRRKSTDFLPDTQGEDERWIREIKRSTRDDARDEDEDEEDEEDEEEEEHFSSGRLYYHHTCR
ncbi:hypothetical protein Tco_0624692 [Tanacetum coccineum]|uniref:Reverse transcriptase domain-containing protein n=1 Tax=Tanacetum coccineum TaxID=301880 RepID=A0ABQ4WEN2_9ASTR